MEPSTSNQLFTITLSPPRLTLKDGYFPLHPQNLRTQSDLANSSTTLILRLFQSTKAHPHRLIHILAGMLFTPSAPKPFGGPRRKPGYIRYKGTTPQSLLEFIVSESLPRRNRFTAVEFVVACVNRVLEMQCFGGAKEALDDLFMRGRMRAGHVVSGGGGGGGGVGDGIPAQFRHVEEGRGKVEGGVEFTPKRSSVKEEWYDDGMVLKE